LPEGDGNYGRNISNCWLPALLFAEMEACINIIVEIAEQNYLLVVNYRKVYNPKVINELWGVELREKIT
jgi:hypothetical protein